MKKYFLFLLLLGGGKCFSQIDFQSVKSTTKEQAQTEVTDLAKASQEEISNYQQKITTELTEKGSVIITAQEAEFLKNLDLPEPQKEVIGNLYVTIPGNNTPVSYQYSVGAGDTFYFSFENKKGKKIYSLDVVEGAEVRYITKNITKKQPVEFSFLVQQDGIISINLTNKYFLKASGQLMVWIKKKKPDLDVSLRRDTIMEMQPGMVYRADTVFVPMIDEQVLVYSKLDLTHSNKYKRALNIPLVENLVGWIFWVGETKVALERLNSLQEQLGMDPLVAYALKQTLFLPAVDNVDLSWVIQNKALGKDIRNGDQEENYGLVNTPFPEGVFFNCINQSNLYDYYVSLKITGMVINKVEEEGEIEVPIINEYYEVTVK